MKISAKHWKSPPQIKQEDCATKSKSPQPTGLRKVLVAQEKHSTALNCRWPVCGRQAVRSSPLPQSLTIHSHKQSYVLRLSRTLYLITTFAHTLYLSQPSTHRFCGGTYTHTRAHAHTHNVLFCYKRTWMWTRPQEARQRCCFKNTACIWRRMIWGLHICEAKHLDGLLTLGCGAGHELHPLRWYQEGRGPKWKFIVHRITQILPRNVILGSSNDTGVSASVCFDSWTFLTFGWMGIWVRPQYCSTTTQLLLRRFWLKVAALI